MVQVYLCVFISILAICLLGTVVFPVVWIVLGIFMVVVLRWGRGSGGVTSPLNDCVWALQVHHGGQMWWRLVVMQLAEQADGTHWYRWTFCGKLQLAWKKFCNLSLNYIITLHLSWKMNIISVNLSFLCKKVQHYFFFFGYSGLSVIDTKYSSSMPLPYSDF